MPFPPSLSTHIEQKVNFLLYLNENDKKEIKKKNSTEKSPYMILLKYFYRKNISFSECLSCVLLLNLRGLY